MSSYKEVTVTKDGTTFISNATATFSNAAQNIAVSGGAVAKTPMVNDQYLIQGQGGEGQLDTNGLFIKSENSDFIFENIL